MRCFLLRLPSRALETSAQVHRHRKRVCDGRHRTVRAKGCLSNKTALAMIIKLAEAAEKSWCRLNGHDQLPKLILGVKFSPTDSKSSDRKLKPLPPDPVRHNIAIARWDLGRGSPALSKEQDRGG